MAATSDAAISSNFAHSLLASRAVSPKALTKTRALALPRGLSGFKWLCPKSRISESAISGRLKIAQRFIAGIAGVRDEVREADG